MEVSGIGSRTGRFIPRKEPQYWVTGTYSHAAYFVIASVSSSIHRLVAVLFYYFKLVKFLHMLQLSRIREMCKVVYDPTPYRFRMSACLLRLLIYR
jgi:hypothetical protein